MYRSREWLYERIRRDKRQNPEISGRALAQKYRVSRNTVAKALRYPVPLKRKKPQPRESVLEPVKGFIDAMLREDLSAPKKQRHTIDRILQRLAAEHDFEHASYSTVRDYVRKRRPQVELEAREGRRHLEGTVPQEKRPGMMGTTLEYRDEGVCKVTAEALAAALIDETTVLPTGLRENVQSSEE